MSALFVVVLVVVVVVVVVVVAVVVSHPFGHVLPRAGQKKVSSITSSNYRQRE